MGTVKKILPYVLRNYQKFRLQEVTAVGGGCMCISKEAFNG